MKREDFIKLLADFIKQEAQSNPNIADYAEPYRQTGDAIVDEALALID